MDDDKSKPESLDYLNDRMVQARWYDDPNWYAGKVIKDTDTGLHLISIGDKKASGVLEDSQEIIPLGICPKCGKFIDHLDTCYWVNVPASTILLKDGELDTNISVESCGKLIGDSDIEHWTCPECYSFLTEDEEEAKKILQGVIGDNTPASESTDSAKD